MLHNPPNMESSLNLAIHHSCNILNFDVTLMGISPTYYDVTLMFYFDILGLEPQCIQT